MADKREPELLPCPFCGSKEVHFLEHEGRYNRKDGRGGWIPCETVTYTADCLKCGCCTDCFNTPEKAAKAWNRRV